MIQFPFRLTILAVLTILTHAGYAGATDDPTSFVLSAEHYDDPSFAPAFIGNGYLGARIPFDGQGYRAKPFATLAQVQGLFGKGRLLPWSPKVEARSSLPVWSSLDYDDGSGPFALDKGTVERYRQSLDLHSGTVSTEVQWISSAGRRAVLHYDVFPDRARPHAAFIRLRFTPAFAGHVVITDSIDPATGRLIEATRTGSTSATQYMDMRTEGLGVTATLASTLTASDEAAVSVAEAPKGGVAQHVVFEVLPGHSYEVIKSVGVAVSSDGPTAGSPHDRAIEAAEGEARLGFDHAKQESDAAWAVLWAGDIKIEGDQGLQQAVRAALFALFASARDDLAWAPSPGGLSNDGYLGHVFWDSETWMFPVYLAVAPQIAGKLLEYRIDRLPAARALAKNGGWIGARFPWESALSGDETVALRGYGSELHINSDIALAIWQYWLASGDLQGLERGFPLLAGIADFWVSYATPNPDGSRSIRNVVPPDEDVLTRGRMGEIAVLAGGGSLVDDSAYTNLSARGSLMIAIAAAKALGQKPNDTWEETARKLRVPSADSGGVLAEYSGYAGGPIKQADVNLLAYPWEVMNRSEARANLEYYAPRTNPNGPSMTDAIHSIIASQTDVSGCSAYSFTRRSVDPFLRAPYSQLAEARAGGVLTFVTGAGGLLQEFLYGYAGVRWRPDGLWLDPSLPPQLSGITLAALHWRDRTIKVEVQTRGTVVTLLSGEPVPVVSPEGSLMLTGSAPLLLHTRLPGERSAGNVDGDNLALCRPAVDLSPGSDPAIDANDGSDFTTWVASKAGQSLTIDLGHEASLDAVSIKRPPVIAIEGKSLFGPMLAPAKIVTPAQTAGEEIELSVDAVTWEKIGRVQHPDSSDVIPANGTMARYIRVFASDAASDRPLVIGEITATARQSQSNPQ